MITTKPKANGYKSLHLITQLEGETKRPIEVQIKTRRMHHFNMYGPASHIFYSNYKENHGTTNNYFWIKGVHKQLYQYHTQKKDTFSSPLESNIFRNRVFVFTPKERLIELPVGSTPVDFAYKLHSNVGNKAIGCRINGEEKQLSHELRNGDVIEIIQDPDKLLPDHEWLHFVRTRRARESIENEHRKILMNSDQEYDHTI
jgi:(p)ppGpp synthase/HD superfamily hydrolase